MWGEGGGGGGGLYREEVIKTQSLKAHSLNPEGITKRGEWRGD